MLASVLDRGQERAERRREHIAELNQRAAEAELRLKRLNDAIESGVADLDREIASNHNAIRGAPRQRSRSRSACCDDGVAENRDHPVELIDRRHQRRGDAHRVADLEDPALRERVVSLKALRDQALADAARAAAMLET